MLQAGSSSFKRAARHSCSAATTSAFDHRGDAKTVSSTFVRRGDVRVSPNALS